jgi:hypothetical protein
LDVAPESFAVGFDGSATHNKHPVRLRLRYRPLLLSHLSASFTGPVYGSRVQESRHRRVVLWPFRRRSPPALESPRDMFQSWRASRPDSTRSRQFRSLAPGPAETTLLKIISREQRLGVFSGKGWSQSGGGHDQHLAPPRRVRSGHWREVRMKHAWAVRQPDEVGP